MNLFNTMPYNVGYTVVGSPTIVNGIASGFSKSDYLTLPSITNDFIKKLNQSSEIGIKLTTPTEEISQYAVLAFFIPYSGTGSGFAFYKEGKKIRWTILTNYYIETPSFNDGDTVWLKGVRNNGIAELLYSTDGTSYISAGTLDISGIGDPSAYGNNAIPKIGINGNLVDGWKYTGSIDLNETYIKVNSQVSTGPVDYTIVGSPTITDGIASGFSANNYLVTSNNIPFSDVTRYDFGAKFTTGSNVATGKYQNIIAYTTNSGGIYSGIRIINSGNLEWFVGRKQGSSTEQISIISSSPLNPNTTYYVKAYSISNIAYLDISTDGVNYNSVGTVSILDDIQIYTGRGFGIGENPSWPYYAFSGSIDLNETYIKVNGKLWFGHESKQVTWFNGKPSQIKVVDISGATGTSSLTNDDKAIVTNKGLRLVTNGSNSKNYIIEDGKLTWANPELYLTGPTQYKVVGNPTIVDNVASGFSSSDYFNIASIGGPAMETYELFTKINTPQTAPSSSQCIIGGIGGWSNMGIIIGSDLKIYGKSYAYVNGTATFLEVSSDAVELNTTYYVKYIIDLINQNRSLMISTDGSSWTTVTRNNPEGYSQIGTTLRIGVSQNSAFTGSIDLNHTYIKVNGDLWFYGKNYATQNIAPVPAGYTYGTTTTPSIGYVDMRTQQFMAAPEGTTYGWDLE